MILLHARRELSLSHIPLSSDYMIQTMPWPIGILSRAYLQDTRFGEVLFFPTRPFILKGLRWNEGEILWRESYTLY